MPIRLRLAVAFGLAAAALFALGGWLFASGLSSAQLKTIDSQLAAQLAQAGRYLQGSGTGTAISSPSAGLPGGDYLIQVVDPADRVRGGSGDAGTAPLIGGVQLSRARRGRISLSRTVDEESARVTAAPLDGHPGWVAVAAGSLETYEATQSQVARELAVGGTVFTAVAGWARTGWRARPCLRWSGCGGRWPRCPSAGRRRAPESRPSRYRPPGTRSRRWPAR